MNWMDISYLLAGNEKQQQAYHMLQKLGVMEVLKEYTPVLVGTIPLDIDHDKSDLDIVCEVYDFTSFEDKIKQSFSSYSGFRIKQKQRNGMLTLVANFHFESFPIEIFGQSKPVLEQNGYRHMLIEARLLEIGGDRAFQEIRKLKSSGVKTEPAFAQYFNIPGDPYEALLELSNLDDEELKRVIDI